MQPKLLAQTEWGKKIAAYLFLAGTGAGAYAWGVVGDISGVFGDLAPKIGVFLGLPCLLVGSLFLVADLGVKPRALNAFLAPRTSWIARGTYIITGFMVLSAIHAAFWVWPWGALADAEGARHVLGGVGVVFAVLTMVYTGVLLGASRPIAMWRAATLPVLFLTSALSTGLMAIALVTSLFAAEVGELTAARLAGADVLLIVAEALVIVFYLQAAHKSPEARASRDLMLRGRCAPHFWLGVVVLGLAVPLVLEAMTYVSGRGALADAALSSTHALTTVVASALGLLGGFFLRYVVLAAGVRAPLRAGGIEYTFPAPPVPAR